MSEKELEISKWNLAIIVIGIFVATSIGFVGGYNLAHNDFVKISDNQTYLYNLGYSNGHNEAVSQFPSQSNEPTVTQSEIMNGIVEALGNADKIDFKVSGDKETGKSSLYLNIEFISKVSK